MFQDGSDQSGSKARSWAKNAASRDARRAVIRSSTSAQPGKSAVSEDGGVPLGWALDDRAPERRGEPADGKED